MAGLLPAMDATREAALVARARSERTEERAAAFDELFRTLRAPVFALCLHLTGSASDAEDALQEVFLAVYRYLPRFRGEARLATWIYRIAINAALRVASRRPRGEPLDVDLPQPEGPDPAVAREESERLSRALATLSADHRVVLSLFAVEGLSHKEIAETLGIPEGTVWSRLHLARKKLAAEMERLASPRP